MRRSLPYADRPLTCVDTMIRVLFIAAIASLLACANSTKRDTHVVSPTSNSSRASQSRRGNGAGFAGSRVRFTVPDGFVRPTRQPTLVHADLRINFSVMEMTVTEQEVSETLQGFDEIGEKLKDLHRVTVSRGHASGFMLSGSDETGILALLAVHEHGVIGAVLLHYPASSASVEIGRAHV